MWILRYRVGWGAFSHPWRKASHRKGYVTRSWWIPVTGTPPDLHFSPSFPVSPGQIRRPQTPRLSPQRRPHCLSCLGITMTGTSSSAASKTIPTEPCGSVGAHPQPRVAPPPPRLPALLDRSPFPRCLLCSFLRSQPQIQTQRCLLVVPEIEKG